MGHSCLSREKDESLLLSDIDYLDEMDRKIEALRMKMYQLEMKCQNNLLEAEKYKEQKAKTQAINALKIMNQRKKTLEQWNGIYLKLNFIRHSMDSVSVTEDLAKEFKRANDILSYATKRLDVEQLENMMDDLGENMDIVREVDDILARPIKQVDEEEMYKEIHHHHHNPEERGIMMVNHIEVNLPKKKEERIKILN
jgi:hypothetical protein